MTSLPLNTTFEHNSLRIGVSDPNDVAATVML